MPMRFFHYVLQFGLLAVLAIVVPAQGAEAPQLRYGFQAGQSLAYQVKIVADTDESIDTREGVLTYTVASADEQQAVLRQSGALAASEKPKGNVGFGPPRFPRPPRFMGPPRFAGPQGVTFNRQGEVVVARDLDHLPYLLGPVQLLVIEEFPAEAKNRWSKSRDIVIQEHQSGPFPFMMGPPGSQATTDRSAKETHEYSVASVEGTKVRIAKKYTLRTSEQSSGGPRFEMTGNGDFVFDTKLGAIAEMAMKFDIRLNQPNVTLRIPLTLNYRVLTPTELAEHQKQAEEARAKAAAAAAKMNAPQPFAAGEREKLLADLKSGDAQRIRQAADRLQKVPVDDAAGEIAAALAPLLTHPDDWVKGAAAKALVVWAAPEAEAALIQATTSESIWVRAAAIEALGRIKTAKAAEAVAAQMYRNRGEAAKALKAMGPVAEKATLGLLKDRDGWVRAEACAVLVEIGGRESLPVLQEFVKTAQHFEKINAEKAIPAIEARLALPPAAEAKPKPAGGLRVWRDAGGVFEIEAALIDVQGDRVRLKRKDGRVITVPVEKLSPDDRKYLERQ